ncbi:MAG: hypothetical protein JWL96_2301 [Sphingomonas bacterium]|uniref:hypothetical protein n=1 Tax=Sphingomonas bacterium TaxID=1895847 RepID=UPI0026225661|nr:hypothetical protein [Sphingomonas bacterium]MDB5710231.1 hypothetical protein [Sphingomonas bacterium]
MRRPSRQFVVGAERGAVAAVIAFLVGAAAPPDTASDLPGIKAARSIVAEWALINRAAAQHRLTPVYAEQMRREARAQLADQRRAMADPRSPASVEIARLLALPPSSDAATLDRGVARLLQIEKQL